MKKKTVSTSKASMPIMYKLILFLAVVLSLSTIYVVLSLQNQVNQIALNEQIYFMQK